MAFVTANKEKLMKVQSLTLGVVLDKVHVGSLSKHHGSVVLACSGRTMQGFVAEDDAEVDCKLCVKQLAVQS